MICSAISTMTAVTAREAELHDRLVAMIAGYSQVTAIVVTGADGHALVATSRFPADHDINFSDRGYFAALRDSGAPFEIGGIVFGRLTRADVFTVAVRRGNDARHFEGAILVGVSPAYFSKFDSDLFAGDTDYSAQLLRADGTPLAGYPEPTQAEGSQHDQLLVDAIARAPARRACAWKIVDRRCRARCRLSPVGQLSGLHCHRPALELSSPRMARRHGGTPDLRHSGDAGPACTQPVGGAAMATTARHVGEVAGCGAPQRSRRGNTAPVSRRWRRWVVSPVASRTTSTTI